MAIITSEQYRMARAALKLSVRDVATMANVSTNTLTRLENGEELKPRTLEAIRNALEKAGVEFTNGDQPGVRMRRSS
ncbi:MULTISPECIES: helix-turn-helix transcriptional regulator [Rhodomicrobium]|uniref:helix-turn-helix domain-containing protein n=1 Tax=Rhodomicrobium TaxID=1068 RepID=UPI001FD99ACD|nr:MULTISPECIES: helix-turn-helix transcriptional regulator [Rhodomicrobium]